MRVAIAAAYGRISPLLDVARSLLVVELDRGVERTREVLRLEGCDSIEKMHEIVGLETDVLICGAVSQQVGALLRAYEIHVIPFVAGNVEAVIDAYVHDRLPHPDFAMPGSLPQDGTTKRDGQTDERRQ